MSDLRYINRALAVVAICLAVFLAGNIAAASAGTYYAGGKRVYLTHPRPHRLALHWGGALVGRWYVACVPASPHVVQVVVTEREVLVDLWYCGRIHRKGWERA